MHRLLTIILLIYAAIGTWILLLSPYESFPDEASHFVYAQHITRLHQLPPLSFERKPLPTNEAFQPPLYYLAIAPLLTLPVSQGTHILLARFFSLSLGAIAILILWKSALLCFSNNPRVAFLVTSIMAFNPQFIFTHAGVSNIAITTVTASMVVFLQARMLVLEKLRTRDACLLGLVSGLALLSRTITIYLVPLTFGVMLIVSYKSRNTFLQILKNFGVFLFTALLLCGWWYARNWIHYSDPFLWKIHQTTMGADWVRTEPLTAFYVARTLAFLHASYWAYFGRNEFHAGITEYALLLFIEVVALIGVYEILRNREALLKEKLRRPAFLVFVFASMFALCEILFLQVKISSPQGRYLYMSAAPISVLLGAGLLQATPEAYRKKLQIGFPLILIGLCLYLLVRYWHPHVN